MVDDENGAIGPDEGPAPPTLAPLEVALPPEHVVGFPLLAAITLRASPPDASLGGLPLPRLSRLAGAVGLELLDDRGMLRARLEAAPRAHVGHGHPTFSLRGAGESFRTLIEVAEAIPFRSCQPGRYALRVTYVCFQGHAVGPGLPLAVRAPTSAEHAALVALEPERRLAGDWGAWPWLPSADPASLRGPFDPRDPLVYLRVLRYLFRGPDEPAAIDPALFDALPPLFAPEAMVLRADLATARGDGAAVAAALNELRRAAPSLAQEYERIAAGQSEIAFARAERRAGQASP